MTAPAAAAVHATAVAELSAWQPTDSRQRALRDRYLAHLAAHPDGLSRACRPGHLTAGALVVNESRDRVLLNLHGKARRWFHFGGHLEPGDTSLAAGAEREVAEESGLVTFRLLPGIAHLDEHVVEFCGGSPTRHLDVRFIALAPDGALPMASAESLQVRWFGPAELPPLEPEMRDLIALARSVEV